MRQSLSAAGIRPAGWDIVARRRDLRENPRPVGVFVPGGQSCGKDGGLRLSTRRYEAAFIEIPEQPDREDHRGVKLRIGPMLGFKRFRTAATTIAGIELLRRIHKGQFNLGGLRVEDRSMPAIWNAVLAA
jgi:hypothetical protein